MKKFLYIAPVFINYEKLDGVGKKILNHVSIFNEKYNTVLVNYGEKGIEININLEEKKIIPYNRVNRRRALYKVVKKLSEDYYDNVYIRYPFSDYGFISMIKKLKKLGSNIVVEIPTYPYDIELFKSLRNFIKIVIDAIFRRNLKKYVDRIITYSKDNNIYGIKTIKTINGINFDKIKVHKIKNRKDEETINLIAVAILWPNHGYDRVINGLKNYYKSGGKRKVIFHIVGEGNVLSEYKKMIDKYKLDKNVILYGFKNGKDLDDIYEISDIAVNSLAIHRLKLKTESTLKAKEYAAKGLPIISSYEIDAFNEIGNNKYVMKVPANDEAIDIDEVIKFYEEIYKNKKSDIHTQIRELSKSICDMKITLNPIIDYLEGRESYEL